MTNDDDFTGDRAPGMGDPTRSDDTDVPALRQGGAGRAPDADASGPAPSGGANDIDEVDTGFSGPQGGQLGSAAGGYGSGSSAGTSGGTPDGEDVQQQAGPGPQTDWLRAEGQSGGARRLSIDAHDEQVADPATQVPSPSQGLAADDERRNLPDAEPG